MLELLVRSGIGRIPTGHEWIRVSIPAIPIEVVEPEDIPVWNREDMLASQEYGDQWLGERRTAVLLLPSVVANGLENNVLINPAHRDFDKITHTEPKKMHQRILNPPATTRRKK